MDIQTVSVVVKGTLQWACRRVKSGRWIGTSEALKLTVQADTYAELMEDIGHTLDLMLQDLVSSNELEKFFRDHGWRTLVPIPDRRHNIRFDVPFVPMILSGTNDPQRNVHQ